MSPGDLALLSLIVGIGPAAIGLTGTLLARLLGCQEGGNDFCYVLGVNVAPFLNFLIAFHFFSLFTMMPAALGLAASGVWALIRLI